MAKPITAWTLCHIHMLTRGRFPRSLSTALSTRSSGSSKRITQEEERDGAWNVLAALEKAKEARSVKVAHLISSLEALLPRDTSNDDLLESEDESSVTSGIHAQQQHTTDYQEHTGDPAFFSIPRVVTAVVDKKHDEMKISGEDVRQLIYATRRGRRVDIRTIEGLLKGATRHFRTKPTVVNLPHLQQNQQLTVIGDLHGSLSDLEAILGLTGEPNRNNVLLFNGDLADRGDHGIEVIVIVCALCLAYPNYIHVNRGNHEDFALSIAYGLAAEIQHKYGANVFRKILSPWLDAFFRSLPIATVLEDDALIVHAGPPPPTLTLADVSKYVSDNKRSFSRTIRTVTNGKSVIVQNEKAQEVIEAILWSDPIIDDETDTLADFHDQFHNSEMLGWIPNVSRGAGYKFDSRIVSHLLECEGLSRLVRSHEPVRQGLVRYVINQHSDIAAKPMEFFTVFSASRYPHKEGFNQGAILKLQPNGKHSVLRYATEEDEPLMGSAFSSSDEENTSSPLCVVDTTSIRQALRDAVSSHRLELTESLEQLTKLHSGGVPFEEVVDALIESLKLDETGFNKPGARLALARALSIECHDTPPRTVVDMDKCIEALFVEGEDDGYISEMAPYYPWLRAVFEIVDVNHDGVISRSEWLGAVALINSKLPESTMPINAEESWKLLDFNEDGQVSSSEWDQLGKALCR